MEATGKHCCLVRYIMSEVDHNSLQEPCHAEVDLAHEFPEIHAIYSGNAAIRPKHCEIWDRILRVARNSGPILDDLRTRGVHLIRIEQGTTSDVDQRHLNECVMEWLPRIHDPLTLSICLGRLGGPGAGTLLRSSRERLFQLARHWNARLRNHDPELTLSRLAQCVMNAARDSDLPDIVSWATDAGLPIEARASYVAALQRFAKKPGLARQTLVTLLDDHAVGGTAVWAIASALRIEAIPLLTEFQRTARDDRPRKAAASAVASIRSRIGRVRLPRTDPARLPEGYAFTSIEFDTVHVPGLLSALEGELAGTLGKDAAEQLALSANQLKRGRRRFHIVPLTLSGGRVVDLGFGFYGEDDDVVVLEIWFDPTLEASVARATRSMLDGASPAGQ